MAEVFGVVASVATLASEGLKLSNALHSYYQKVKNAEEDVKKVSKDVKSTAVVLRQLEDILRQDARWCSKDFYDELSENVGDCQTLFGDIRAILSQSKKQLAGGNGLDEGNMHTKARLKWPFNTERVTLLRNDLDRLKLDVGLKIDVIRFKREVHESWIAEHEREIAKKENMYNIRIGKHNIKIRRLKLEVAQQRYQHMRKRAIPEESTGGPSANAGAGSKDDKQQHTPERFGKHSKENGKEAKGKKPAGMTSVGLSKGKGRSDKASPKTIKTTSASAAVAEASASPKAQDPGGSQSPKTEDKIHQGDNSEQRHLRNQKAEAGESHDPSWRAIGSTTIGDMQDLDPPSPTNPKLFGNRRYQKKPLLAIGYTGSTRSARMIPPNSNFDREDMAMSVFGDEVEAADLDEAMAGPSTSRNVQSRFDEQQKPAGSSEDRSIDSVDRPHAAIDRNSVRSSILENGSSSAISVDSSGSDDHGGEAAANISVEELGESLIQNGSGSEQTVNPQISSGQRSSSGQTKHSLAVTNNGNQETNDAKPNGALHTYILSKLRTLLGKTRPAGIGKNKIPKQKIGKAPLSPSSRGQSATSTAASAGGNHVDRPPDHEVRQSRRNPLPNPVQPPELISDNNRPIGPPYESRNVRDRVNFFMWPTYPTAQDTQTLLELWQFRRYTSPEVHAKSWGHVTRDWLPLDESELQRMVERFRKKKVPVARAFAGLTSYQQRQVHLLVLERHSHNDWRRFRWTLQTIETFPRKTKSKACESMQVILERRFALGALNEPHTVEPFADIPPGPGPPDIGPMHFPQGFVPPPPMRHEGRLRQQVYMNPQERIIRSPPAVPDVPSSVSPQAHVPPPVSFVSTDYSEDGYFHRSAEPAMVESSEEDVVEIPLRTHQESGFEKRIGKRKGPNKSHFRELSFKRKRPTATRVESLERNTKKMAEKINGKSRKGNAAWEASIPLSSFERGDSRPYKSHPLGIRKKSSEDSVDDLISKWTVENAGESE